MRSNQSGRRRKNGCVRAGRPYRPRLDQPSRRRRGKRGYAFEEKFARRMLRKELAGWWLTGKSRDAERAMGFCSPPRFPQAAYTYWLKAGQR